MIRRNITFQVDLWVQIQHACAAEEKLTGESVSASLYVRRAVRDYLIQKGRV